MESLWLINFQQLMNVLVLWVFFFFFFFLIVVCFSKGNTKVFLSEDLPLGSQNHTAT